MRRLCLLFLAGAALGATPRLHGYVTRVVDGDTVIVELGSGPARLRLGEIDAPERDQPYGRESKAALSRLILHKSIEIEPMYQDRYERLVGRAYLGRLDVNSEMVRAGNAWAFDGFLQHRALCTLEAEARARKQGLWALPAGQRIPPMAWRYPRARLKNVCDRRSS